MFLVGGADPALPVLHGLARRHRDGARGLAFSSLVFVRSRAGLKHANLIVGALVVVGIAVAALIGLSPLLAGSRRSSRPVRRGPHRALRRDAARGDRVPAVRQRAVDVRRRVPALPGRGLRRLHRPRAQRLSAALHGAGARGAGHRRAGARRLRDADERAAAPRDERSFTCCRSPPASAWCR